MPISAELLLDTSAAVALCLAATPDHRRVVERTAGGMLGLAGHAAAETYSVLTRLPSGNRLSPTAALRVIQQNFPATHHLSADRAQTVLADFARLGIAGGSVYDGLVAAAAREAGVVLLSNDRRAAATYSRLGTAFELI